MFLCKFGKNPNPLHEYQNMMVLGNRTEIMVLKQKFVTHLIRRHGVGNVHLYSFHGLVTLKIRSRSPKSNQL